MTYLELLASDRKRVILQLLAESDAYRANEFLLHTALPGFGHAVSHDRLRVDLAWLAEQGLVTIEETAGVRVAQLTARGADVAAGRAVVPGVKRPEPRG